MNEILGYVAHGNDIFACGFKNNGENLDSTIASVMKVDVSDGQIKFLYFFGDFGRPNI